MRVLLLTVMSVAAGSAQNWDAEVDRYFNEAVFPASPSGATSAGFHEFDNRLEDFSRAAILRQAAKFRKFETEVAAFPDTPDRELVLSNIRSALLSLETIRMWEKNPDIYSSTASSAAFVIMSRTFAPPEARLRSLIAREKLMPKLFVDARANLKSPPRVYTEVALEQLPGIVRFFEKDVPLAFAEVKDPVLTAGFQQANNAVIVALRNYEEWLRKDLLPRSKGDFRFGAETFRKKLLYDEMVDLPLDRLLEIGYQDLRKNQEAFRAVAKQIDASKTPQAILEDAEKDHPAPGQLLEAFTNTLLGLRTFIEQHHIAEVPSQVLPRVEETPPFMRALTFASMDAPGPYEKVATEAFFNVTLPEASWKPAAVEEHMAAFNKGVIISTAVHEAFPGHYLQQLWLDRATSKVRKLTGANTYVEGWAHYCEQMMLDEGYGNGDPKLRLGQLQDALLRNARYIVAIEMHTGKMTFDQGVDFFVKEGFQTRTNGERETKRGTSDATYLYYTLGKLEILKLREDYKRMRGAAYTLEEFHNKLLAEGNPPLKIVRRALLKNDTPVL